MLLQTLFVEGGALFGSEAKDLFPRENRAVVGVGRNECILVFVGGE